MSGHRCDNCEGVDPSSCINADRPERPDPTDTDREAVARVLYAADWDGEPPQPNEIAYADNATAILTTTDPAARAALIRSLIAGGAQDVLDELVRKGVFTGETGRVWTANEAGRLVQVHSSRLVTAWEPVTPSKGT